MAEIIIDAMGKQCPIPVVLTTKELNKLTEPGTIEVHVDNEVAVQNLLRLAASKNLKAQKNVISEKEFTVTISADAAVDADADSIECEDCSAASNISKGLVVAITSDRMGEGNDELGKVLIKGFIYALSQLEKLPETIVFYNGGATIPVENSDSLADLKNMEEQGVQIITCGTCLDYYNLKEKLAVGSISNMYTIVETLTGAAKVVRP